MTFTEQLYTRVSEMYPGTTNRSFSILCGKCESYISSIMTQDLEISTSAIMQLMEVLETRKMSIRNAGANPKLVKRVSDLQMFMADEIAKRQHESSVNQNSKIRQMLLEAVSNLADQETESRSAMPMYFG